MNKDGRLPLIAPAEAAAKIREGALAADIRSRAEYRGGHIGGALSLPPELHRGKLPDNAAPCLIFYCLGGKRTAMAEAVLAAGTAEACCGVAACCSQAATERAAAASREATATLARPRYCQAR